MNRERLPSPDSSNTVIRRCNAEKRPPTPRDVLEELFQLLEDYAPTWYTEEHHNRAVAALAQSSGTKATQIENDD